MLVLDASVAASWCFPDEQTEWTNGVLRAITGPGEAMAPRLWAYEIRNSVLTGCRRGRIGKTDAQDFTDLSVQLSDPPSYEVVFALADRYGLTFYDAAYLELASREALPLASLDDHLRRTAVAFGIRLFEPGG